MAVLAVAVTGGYHRLESFSKPTIRDLSLQLIYEERYISELSLS